MNPPVTVRRDGDVAILLIDLLLGILLDAIYYGIWPDAPASLF